VNKLACELGHGVSWGDLSMDKCDNPMVAETGEHVALLVAFFTGLVAVIRVVRTRDTPSDRGKRSNTDPPE
jgi:hypothetical protein